MKILTIVKVPQIAPKVALRWIWPDDQNRRCSQYLGTEFTQEDAEWVLMIWKQYSQFTETSYKEEVEKTWKISLTK